MLELIKRNPKYVAGYKEYCRELYDNHVAYFRPTDPKFIDDEWFFVPNHGMTEKNRDLLKVSLSVFTIGQLMTANSSENFNSGPNSPKR